MTIKITPTMRRMCEDRDFFEAVEMLNAAQRRLRELEGKRRHIDGLDDIRYGVKKAVRVLND